MGGLGGTDSGEHRVEGRGQLQEAVEGEGASSSGKWMEEGYGTRQGVRERLIKAAAGGVGEGEPQLLLGMFGHTSITLYLIVNLLIYSIKMI